MPKPTKYQKRLEQLTGEEQVELASIFKAAETGKVPQTLKNIEMSQGQIEVFYKRTQPLVAAVRTRAMLLSMTTDDPRLLRAGLEAADAVENRVLGKPTERTEMTQNIKVIVGGLDLNRLPDLNQDGSVPNLDLVPKLVQALPPTRVVSTS